MYEPLTESIFFFSFPNISTKKSLKTMKYSAVIYVYIRFGVRIQIFTFCETRK